ncbi:uncharacterized protein LOC110716347 [Chenopodium quinoa]|uniref:uncharacterized protein LOC110716347 n=1 Tax=Chenopodium quinoa TaxID=63459 RepID=UPI000B7706F1|nr:uncharacterized protein LOC110716347 [Chenopodium quinoa]
MEKNKQLKGSWLAEQLLDVFKARPHRPAKEIIETVRRAYRVIIRKEFAYKVKWHAHKKLHGSMREHYGKVGRYLEALKRSSPNTQLDLVTYMDKNKPPQIFQRLYVCFEGLQKGWMEGCRKIICVDACFLKTFLGGQLMSAVGRDGNDQMYPIAWAVVEGENNTSWEWFLNNLSKSLQLGDGSGTVIVSDEHQAILRGSCAKSYSEADYRDALNKLETTNAAAAAAAGFKSYNPNVFCRAFLKTDVKADAITSNMAETFNGYIINARAKHLLYMLEDIRAALMRRLVIKRQEMEKWKSVLCPRIQKKLESEKEEAANCEVIPSSQSVFQVSHILDTMSVDLEKRTCTCRKWDMCGIPCCHAVAAIFFCHKKAEDYVDECYKKEMYLKAYENSIPPIEGERHWPQSELSMDPPPIKVGPGRPRKNRRKDPFEDPKKPGKLTKHGMEMTCSVCQQKGHNKRRCPIRGTTLPQAPQTPDEPPAKRARGRPRKEVAASQPMHPCSSTHLTATTEPSRIGRGGRVISRGGNSAGRGTGRARGRDAPTSKGGRTGRGGEASSSMGRGVTTTTGGNRGGRGTRGGRGRGRNQVPQGFGVYLTSDGSTFTNPPGSAGPQDVSAYTTTFSYNFSQGSSN